MGPPKNADQDENKKGWRYTVKKLLLATTISSLLSGTALAQETAQNTDQSAAAGADYEQIVVTELEERTDEKSYIKITDLLYGGLTLLASYPSQYLKKIEEESKKLSTLLFSPEIKRPIKKYKG